jgi:hypothetical protein
MAKVGLEPTATTALNSSRLQLSPLSVGAESGAVTDSTAFDAALGSDVTPLEQPASPLVTAILALANQLSPADRAMLVRLLSMPGRGGGG